MNRRASCPRIKQCFLAIAVVLGTTCSSYDGFELRLQTTPPGEVTVNAGSVILPQGMAVAVRVHAPGAQDPETGELYVSIESSDPSVLGVSPTVEQAGFVLYGTSEGTATLTVKVEGEDDKSVPAKVKRPTGVSPSGSAGAGGT